MSIGYTVEYDSLGNGNWSTSSQKGLTYGMATALARSVKHGKAVITAVELGSDKTVGVARYERGKRVSVEGTMT